mmetsp:Transcript_64904/g.186735  ORF Transcript_64904/g.186735 Transcript_64904/m.186735 type:complete len:346 (+) Transcript_64904:1-1038(+)
MASLPPAPPSAPSALFGETLLAGCGWKPPTGSRTSMPLSTTALASSLLLPWPGAVSGTSALASPPLPPPSGAPPDSAPAAPTGTPAATCGSAPPSGWRPSLALAATSRASAGWAFALASLLSLPELPEATACAELLRSPATSSSSVSSLSSSSLSSSLSSSPLASESSSCSSSSCSRSKASCPPSEPEAVPLSEREFAMWRCSRSRPTWLSPPPPSLLRSAAFAPIHRPVSSAPLSSSPHFQSLSSGFAAERLAPPTSHASGHEAASSSFAAGLPTSSWESSPFIRSASSFSCLWPAGLLRFFPASSEPSPLSTSAARRPTAMSRECRCSSSSTFSASSFSSSSS